MAFYCFDALKGELQNLDNFRTSKWVTLTHYNESCKAMIVMIRPWSYVRFYDKEQKLENHKIVIAPIGVC